MRSAASMNEAIGRGLRRDADHIKGLGALTVCSGLRPTEFGAKRFKTISQPFGASDALSDETIGEYGTKAWPFPQMFRGRNTTILAFDDGIFQVAPSGLTAWTASEYTVKAAEDYLKETPGEEELDASGPWQFVDFWSFWMLFGLDYVCWKSPHSDYVWASDDVTVRTGCNYKDARLFLGGFDQTDMYDLVDWPAYFSSLFGDSSHLVQTAMASLGQGAAGNWVWWSSIGGGDALWLWCENLLKYGNVNGLATTTYTPDIILNGGFDSATGWNLGTNWAIADGVLTHTPGSTSETDQVPAGVYPDTNYRVTFTVSGRTAGSVWVRVGSTPGNDGDDDHITVPVSANGAVSQLVVSGGPYNGAIVLVESDSAFDGSIDNLAVEMANDPDDQVGYTASDTQFMEMLHRNEFGMAPMPFQGNVVNMKQLGNSVVAYGQKTSTDREGGVCGIVPGGALFGLQAIAGLGENIGIGSRCALAGDDSVHAFVDYSGDLWVINSNLQAERLGYREYLSPMMSSGIVMNYDDHEKEFYIGNGSDCYLLNRNGLSRNQQIPTSLFVSQQTLVGIRFNNATISDNVTLTTCVLDAMDFGGQRGDVVTLDYIRIATTDIDSPGWQVQVSYRMKTGQAWSSSAVATFDGRGIAKLGLGCIEFQLTLTHGDRTKTTGLDSVTIEANAGMASLKTWLNASDPGAATV